MLNVKQTCPEEVSSTMHWDWVSAINNIFSLKEKFFNCLEGTKSFTESEATSETRGTFDVVEVLNVEAVNVILIKKFYSFYIENDGK